MTKEELWDGLRSESSVERVHAVREIGRAADPSAVDRLVAARADELDSWVLRAIDTSLEQLRRSTAPTATGALWVAAGGDPDLEDLLASATQRASGTLIHEARPLINEVQISAKELLGDSYPGSRLSLSIDRVKEFLDTMTTLHDASQPAAFIEFDLTALIAELIPGKQSSVEVVSTRSDPSIVRGDPNLLRLALENVVRNAVDASPQGERVVVHSARTDTDAWVAVLDNGSGLPSNFSQAFAVGTTTKSKESHFGMGLAIAEQAVRSMRGSIVLSPRESKGTSCEIRWNQQLQGAA